MGKEIKLGFEKKGVVLKLESILPLKRVKEGYKKSKGYLRIKSSIEKVNVIEPLIVYPQKDKEGSYLLLDGHTRLEILKEIGKTETLCLISTDDEGYTYNHHVNRISTIQEHFMILRALENGVSEERIAETLEVNIEAIRAKRNLLQGICPEAVNLLKDCPIGKDALQVIKKVHPIRQLEMVELMKATNNFTKSYARALLVATDKEQVLESEKSKTIEGINPEHVAKMEKELGKISHEFNLVKDTYGRNMLNLVLTRAYISKLLNNARVVRYLSTNRAELLAEYQKLVEITSLEG